MPFLTYKDARYELREQETVLEALMRGGADVKFSCRKGACQACLLRATRGTPPSEAQRTLRPELVESGHFMPCLARAADDLVLEEPDLGSLSIAARVAAKHVLGPDVVQLLLEPELNLDWRPGQYLQLLRDDGLSRPYSIASIHEEDYFVELHVRRIHGGQLSNWIHDVLQPNDELRIQGPLGDCVYDPAMAQRPLLLIGTSTGIAPLYGIAREALRSGHTAGIHIYFGARSADGLYLAEDLRSLAGHHPSVHYTACVSGDEVPDGVRAGHASVIAFQDFPETAGHVVYLCGNPDMVDDARYRAVLAGSRRADIIADPFDTVVPAHPRDLEKLAATRPDAELWDALGQGTKLRAVLEDFYGRVYEDSLLAPFFHNVTMERAISKQYAFLRDVFTGKREYFGLRPFNAHHWMIISDDLFDYRETLFEDCLRRHGLREDLIRRWSAFHELFRREIVKSRERGIILGGEEHLHVGYSIETVDIGTLCDGCEQEIEAGAQGRMHKRTGQFYCMNCEGQKTA